MPIMLSFYEIFWVLRMIFKQLKPNPSSSIGLTAQEPLKFSYSTFLKLKWWAGAQLTKTRASQVSRLKM